MICSCCKQQTKNAPFSCNSMYADEKRPNIQHISSDQQFESRRFPYLSNADENYMSFVERKHILPFQIPTAYPRATYQSLTNPVSAQHSTENKGTHPTTNCAHRLDQLSQTTKYPNNSINFSKPVTCKPRVHFDNGIQESQNNGTSRELVNRKPNMYETRHNDTAAAPVAFQESLRIIEIQIKRLRGISAQLKRCSSAEVLFEILGKCVSTVEQFINIPGFHFVLQEIQSNFYGATVDCVFYNFDELSIEVKPETIYRCVGRYHADRRVFQCFMIEPCDSESIRLLEELQIYSDREVAKLIQSNRRSEVKNARVVKVPYLGLGRHSYSRRESYSHKR
ncbi:hypothetical protein FGIG_03968 [Fasciola gigantica]|uniref:Spermatogenesis-associated protein 22 n=1 Tax=Fasciola gigantica TaxID=46835 RepID=A0A504YRV3_FASGI|nr:hypothetical protein FGIG_03968 [Fasciola gigantica]